LAEELIGKFGYVGIAIILILGGLGLPIPEEAPIIVAAILTRNGQMSVIPALASCLGGVLLGDFVVYALGYCYGEKVLRLPITRRLLTRQREAQIKGYFHRHGFKILVSGRFVPGFRTAAYLTAGILKLPALKLLVTDLVAVTLSTLLMFGLGFLFAIQIQKGIREVQQWITLVVAVGVGSWLLYRFYRARRRAGLPVGPPVLDVDEVALPPVEPDEPTIAGEDLLGLAAPKSVDTRSDVPGPIEHAPDGGPSAAPASAAVASGTSAPPARPADPMSIGLETPSTSPAVESTSR
jgi:membrane protein DedA with SNARE-associated domain